MAVSRKGKRKIVVSETVFYWYIKWDEDWYLENVIYILNADRQRIYSYIVGKDETKIFQRSVQSPVWIESNGLHNPTKVDTITPSLVSEIIKWCLENKEHE